MTDEQEIALTLDGYLEAKESSPLDIPANHPTIQFQVLTEHAIECVQTANQA